ncbi:MAG: DUF4097 domain-containing protein [Fimbriimonas sp.]
MREEIQRISKLVAEGKLSPEDAADLIDAFYASDRMEEESGPTPPPPPPGTSRDPFRGIIDQIEKLTKEGAEAVDWKEVSKQARESAKKGFDFLKTGLDDLSKGKVNFFGNTETKNISLPLSVPEGKTLKIENACGDVKVSSGASGGSVTADARFKGSSIDDAKAKAQAYTLIIEESETQVIIRQPDVSGLSVDLDVKISGKAQVEIKAENGDISVIDTGLGARLNGRSGDIKVRGLNGQIEIHSESGDMTIENSETTSLTVENKSGDIDVRNVRGNMNIRTASGNVRAGNCSGKTVAFESISGDVHVDLVEPVTGNVNVRTVNGDAAIAVADGCDCRVSLSTLRGSVSCALELQEEAKAQQRITGKLGAGGGTLDVSAVTGDVRLEMRTHETATV